MTFHQRLGKSGAFGPGLMPQLFGHLGGFRLPFDLRHQGVQPLPLALHIKAGDGPGRVVFPQFLPDPAVAESHHKTRGKVHQRGVVRPAQEFHQVNEAVHVDGQRVTNVGVKVREAGTVDDEIELAGQAGLDLFIQPEPRLGHIALQDFDALGHEPGKFAAVELVEGLEDRRFFDDFLKPAHGGRRSLPTDQQVDLPDFGQVAQRVRQPDLADEACGTDEENVFSSERATDG